VPGVGTADANTRRGVAPVTRVIAERDGQASPPTSVQSQPLTILGPGDVIGIDPAQVVRRAPRPGEHAFEPNYLAAIEFAHPDLPWLFSPVAQDDRGKAMPWLMLVVVDVEPGHEQAVLTARPGAPNPVLEVPDASVLPEPADAWAWAHVQVRRPTAEAARELLARPSAAWADARSRLVAPTRIEPEHAYLACVVPVYAAGREAGLSPKAPTGLGLTLAWERGAPVALPVYDHWRFRAGPAGDFETLARKLQPVEDVPNLGQRLVAIEPLASRLQSPEALAEDGELFPAAVRTVPTALARPDASWPFDPSSDADAQVNLRPRLKELVDRVALESTADEPLVGPPLYGQWHAEVASVDGHPGRGELVAPPDEGPQRWVEELNADPYNRIAAGMATRVVQHDQEPLMAAAWDQLDELIDANRRIRASQLLATSAKCLYARVEKLNDARALRLTAPALTRVLSAAGTTIATAIDTSVVSPQVLGASFVRLSRFANRTGASWSPTTESVQVAVDALRAGSATVVPTRFVQPRAVDHGVVAKLFELNPHLQQYFPPESGIDPHELLTEIDRTHRLVVELADQSIERVSPIEVVPDAVGEPVLEVESGTAAARHLEEAVSFLQGLVDEGRLDVGARVADQLRVGANVEGVRAFTPDLVQVVNHAINEYGGEDAPSRVNLAQRGFRVTFDEESLRPLRDFTLASGASDTEAEVLTRTDQLRTAALTRLGLGTSSWSQSIAVELDDHDRELVRADAEQSCSDVTPVVTAPEVPRLATLAVDTAHGVVEGLSPLPAYVRMLEWAHQITAAGNTRVQQRTPLHPLIATPQFDEPLVERLRAVDPDWVLGGVRELPPNSIVVLEINERFVEAFAAGANHEMARELLWRGFPTNLRGSCFPRFWPRVHGGNDESGIEPLETWTRALGANGYRDQDAGGLTVVAVKGDLLRRYPATIITAEHGTWTTENATTFTNDGPSAKELFRGFLEPDVTYVALDVSMDTLLEYDPRHPYDCWYLSFRQPLDEPRFGLDASDPDQVNQPNREDDPDNWSWAGLPDRSDPRHLTPASVFADDNSARVATRLFQRPFRLLLRARDYLPGGG
jgi:hypothetical protein